MDFKVVCYTRSLHDKFGVLEIRQHDQVTYETQFPDLQEAKRVAKLVQQAYDMGFEDAKKDTGLK